MTLIVVFAMELKLSVRMFVPVPVPLGGWDTSPRLRPIEKTAPSESWMLPPTLSRFRSRPMKIPVPAPLKSMPLRMSRVLTSPPVVIEPPGRIDWSRDPVDRAGSVGDQWSR